MSDTAVIETVEEEITEENTAPETEGSETATEDTAETPAEFTLQDVRRRFFNSEQLEDAETLLGKIYEVCPESVLRQNWNFSENQVPAGHGIGIVPISKRADGETKVVGVALAVVPEFATVYSDEKGKNFIVDNFQTEILNKVATSVRPDKDGKIPPNADIPVTADDGSFAEFIQTQRRSESLRVYNLFAPKFVKALRKKAKGMEFLSPLILRQCLMSRSFADDMFSKIPQESWTHTIDMMCAFARKKAEDPAVMESWKNTRDEHEIELESDETSFNDALAGLE